MKRKESQLQSLPREVLTRIHKLSGPKSRTASTLVSKDMQESTLQTKHDGDLICLFVLKLLSRLSPATRNWEGSANRAAYWWVGRRGVLSGQSNKPPDGVSKRPGGKKEVQKFCHGDRYPKRCLVFLIGLMDYVEKRWRNHVARTRYQQVSNIYVLFERPEDAHVRRWEPEIAGTGCWRSGCCVSIEIPRNEEAAIGLAHASSLYPGNKRQVLLSPTPYADLDKDNAPIYADFFLNRGRANCSIRYISLWQRRISPDGRKTVDPPLQDFRLFGAEFGAVHDNVSIPDAVGLDEEVPMKQFARAELLLNVDLHAISVPFRSK